MDPVVVSYFTEGTNYEKEAAALRASCENVGLEYRIEGVASFGKWHQHTCYKPIYILQKMHELKRPVVWVDADAEVVKKPSFAFDCDIGVRIYDFHPSDHPSHFLAGTVYIAYNERTLRFVKAWADACQKIIEGSTFLTDQQVFGSLAYKEEIRLLGLPAGYCAIFDERVEQEIYIVHYQASRLYKKIVDGDVAFGFYEQLSVEDLRKLRPRVH